MTIKTYIFMFNIMLLSNLCTESLKSELSLQSTTDCYADTKEEGAWKYMEYIFIIQPKSMLNANVYHIQSGILTLSAFLFIARNHIYQYVTNSKEKTDCIDIPTLFATGMIGKIGYDFYLKKEEALIKKQLLIKFLNNWDYHRKFAPLALISAFDELSDSLLTSKTKTLSDDQVNNVYEIIQHLIEHTFSKRYEKDKTKETDMLGMLKTITDIGKNLK